MTPTPRQKLQQLLRDLFQFDSTDLDFGIYRIMNFRRAEIERFIEKDLLDAVSKGFEEIKKGESKEITAEVETLAKKIKHELGAEAVDVRGNIAEAFKNTPLAKEYVEKKAQLAEIKISEQLESELYSDIYNFFSRYWSDGDFLSLRRYSKQNKYAIPYNGEEVMLYWANFDQYYIKTTEYFKDYSFKAGEYTVHFKIVAAQTEQNNVKGEKRFFLLNSKQPNLTLSEAKSLDVLFEYRPLNESEKISYGAKNQQEKINEEIEKNILDSLKDLQLKKLLAAKNSEEERSLTGKHLYRYTRRNTTDYFIHKDLKGFLERELDFYIKNEIMMLDDLETTAEIHYEKYLTKVKVLKRVCRKIIEFLAQIENFQKKLWEKRKFVLETNYCMTLDNVPEEFYDEILSNKGQLEEWKELFKLSIDIEKRVLLDPEDTPRGNKQSKSNKKDKGAGLGLATKLDKNWLISKPTLVLDTKFFNEEFKDLLLARAQNLDERVCGLMIQGENFQALNLLFEKYKGKVKSIYIDPPFNAKSSEILYKNDYKHSSWLSLIENRILLARYFLAKNGVFVIAIDEMEQEKLGLTLNEVFPFYEKTCVAIVHNPSGQQGDNFSSCHEYAYFVYPRNGRVIGMESRKHKPDVRPLRDVSKGSHLREDAANCFYPIYIKDQKIVGFGDVCDDSFHPSSANVKKKDGVIEIYPIDAKGFERKWVFERGTVEDIEHELTVEWNKEREIWDIIRTKTDFNFKTVWTDKKYSANSYGSKLLNQILGGQKFSFPKSLYTEIDCISASINEDRDAIVLDFFAGSGTTGHAILAINKEMGEHHKYLLIEMEDYFYTALKPRIEKIMYCTEWKDGKPVGKEGVSHIFKYQKIEGYEDTLNNIKLMKPQGAELFETEDYVLRYMLNYESNESTALLNVEKLSKPFDYELEIYKGGERAKQKVDLIETFNYLLGVQVKHVRAYTSGGQLYRVVFGSLDAKSVVIIWRNTEGLDLEKDKEFIEKEILNGITPDLLYINGDSVVPHALPIEKTFKERMFAPVNV